jgi:hypothetical protein
MESLHEKINLLIEQNQILSNKIDSLIHRQNKKFIHNELEFVKQYIPKPSETFIDWFQKALQGNDWLDQLRLASKPEDTLVWLLKRAWLSDSPIYSFEKRKQIAIYDDSEYRILNENDVQMMVSHFQVRCTLLLEDWKSRMDHIISKNASFDEDEEDDEWGFMIHFHEKQYLLDSKKISSLSLHKDRMFVSLVRKLHSTFLEYRMS